MEDLRACDGGDSAYDDEEAEWRDARAKRICGPLGWRSVCGLYWLPEGAHDCGAASDASIPLPLREGVPQRVLRVVVEPGGRVGIRAQAGVDARLGGNSFDSITLEASAHGVDAISVLGFMIEIMRRGPGVGARVRDAASPRLEQPCPLRWFPPRKEWRVCARLEPVAGLRVPIVNVLGDEEYFASPGQYVFDLGGRKHRLTPFLETPDSSTLFFVFRDRTNGKDTYGAGRFLFADREPEITLDFNRAVSPPCAYTEFATCPMPPEGNALDLIVAAGERTPASHPYESH